MCVKFKDIACLLLLICGISGTPTGTAQITGPADELGIDDDDSVYAIANDLVMENARLEAQRLEIEKLLDSVDAQEDEVTRRTLALAKRFATARQIVEDASESDALGAILFAYWESIDSYRLADPTTQLARRLGDTVIDRINHEEALADTADVSGYITDQIGDADLDPATIAESNRAVLVELVLSRREQLRRIIEMESEYIVELSELEADYSRLTTNIGEYE